MKLFIVDFWEPFPSSEYGGVVVVAGNDKDEVYNILLSHFTYHKRDHSLTEYKFSDRLRTEVDSAREFELKDDISAGIIKMFIT